MTSPDFKASTARTMGARIRAARETRGLTQHQLSDAVGFADRQTMSTIETGERKVQPAELVKLSQILARPLDWFIDPFVIEGEAQFSWRVSRSVTDSSLAEYEAKIGQIVGLFRHLNIALNGPSKALGQFLRMPPNPAFEDAWRWGEAVAQELDLGTIPSEVLAERIETRLDIAVLHIDADICTNGTHSISGAMCRLPDLGVIVINRQESRVRRNFDVAHELFHALTWDALTPEHREDTDAKPVKRSRRIEQLADNFAAAVLMPTATLSQLIDPAGFSNTQHLAEVAKQLEVSTHALAFRLFNAKMIDKLTCLALCEQPPLVPRCASTPPKLLSASFVKLLHDGIARGHVSTRKAAKALSMTLEGLAELMRDYGKSVPFAI
ncbi:XRE family transcriptional regulator [Cupriavidus plantarum]|uniref:XRE family transcriptional regulator n=1 Tax=Cupriavidus plantarum TaxID=942865 RepID=UPI001B15D277|nr:XRE family transcriptional regulator [Cupriavidus plantarum]CAG2139705.1 hypothetical protein LMG26296_02913 [Cupriavidus plantarum]SMR85680.1 Helix-turn-helix domain-containing protein [Cupriavidus plantarum]